MFLQTDTHAIIYVGFARRYFTLFHTGILSYAFEPGQPIRDQVSLHHAAISTAPGRKDIHIDSNNATFHLKCLSTEDFDHWMAALRYLRWIPIICGIALPDRIQDIHAQYSRREEIGQFQAFASRKSRIRSSGSGNRGNGIGESKCPVSRSFLIADSLGYSRIRQCSARADQRSRPYQDQQLL